MENFGIVYHWRLSLCHLLVDLKSCHVVIYWWIWSHVTSYIGGFEVISRCHILVDLKSCHVVIHWWIWSFVMSYIGRFGHLTLYIGRFVVISHHIQVDLKSHVTLSHLDRFKTMSLCHLLVILKSQYLFVTEKFISVIVVFIDTSLFHDRVWPAMTPLHVYLNSFL